MVLWLNTVLIFGFKCHFKAITFFPIILNCLYGPNSGPENKFILTIRCLDATKEKDSFVFLTNSYDAFGTACSVVKMETIKLECGFATILNSYRPPA